MYHVNQNVYAKEKKKYEKMEKKEKWLLHNIGAKI